MNKTPLSQSIFPEKFFITGTDTDVGKTVTSAILAAGLRANYWKPVQSGLSGETDTEVVKRLSGLPASHFFKETYRLKEPLSPHASAALENIHIQLDRFSMPETDNSHPLIVEGAGGIFVPLNEEEYMLDLMKQLNLPVLIVARSGLGTINHTLMSIGSIRDNGLDLLGVIMNGPQNTSNREAIEHYGRTRVLAEITPLTNLNEKTIKKAFADHFKPDGDT